MFQVTPARDARTTRGSACRNRLLFLGHPASLVIALALATLLLAGCSGDPGGMQTQGGPSAPTLHCATRQTTGQIDVIEVTLTCAVSGAAASETSFTLSYTAINSSGHRRTFDATCDGALHNGEGSCMHTYALVVPFELASSTVTGKLLPDNRALGPVTPTKS